MSGSILTRYVTPWRYRRLAAEQRLNELRERDGDECRRCRRPLRFDLPNGHDQAPKVEPLGDGECLCHTRCNPGMVDHTGEVTERVRRKSEAELFAKARKRKARKAA